MERQRNGLGVYARYSAIEGEKRGRKGIKERCRRNSNSNSREEREQDQRGTRDARSRRLRRGIEAAADAVEKERTRERLTFQKGCSEMDGEGGGWT